MSINTSISMLSMAWQPTYHPVWTFVPTQTQGPGLGVLATIQFIQNYDYPPPPGYIFLNPLGAGGCGKVYLAKHLYSGLQFAVKCVKIINNYSHFMADAFWKEIMALNGKPHPHLITCYGAGQSPDDPSVRYLFLEYMDMGSVKDLYKISNINIPEAIVRECISHVLVGLVHIHSQNIIHRDLKGENILKDSKGFYKIADFGLCKLCSTDSSSGSNCLMTANIGTPTHMAPEVNNPTGNVQYDTKADIWSLGCLVLEISSCGQLKVDVDTHLYSVPPVMSFQGVNFIYCCLQVDPACRPTSSILLNHDWFKI